MSNNQFLPLVSVIVDGFNQEQFVGEAIESVLAQSYPNIEIIVVDDGSTDNSKAVISSYGSSIHSIFKPNGGQSSALNCAVEQSHGEIICFLDADDIFLPDKVSQVVDAFQSNLDIGWCFHPLRYINKTVDQFIVNYPPPPQEESCEIDFRDHIINSAKIPVWGPATSALSLRRSLAESIFPIPEYLHIASDAYIRYPSLALSKGFFLNQPLSILRMHDTNTYNSNLKDDKQRHRYAKSLIYQANALRGNFLELRKVSNKLFAWGLADLGRDLELEFQRIIKSYLSTTSLLEKFEIYFRTFWHRAKQKAQ